MREIKFRAWDIVRKEYIHSPRIDICINDVNTELEQYTGLKDKNGKEIYEGDIVKTESGVIATIVFLPQEMGYVLVFKTHDSRLGHRSRGSGYDQDMTLEIIGNIHEAKS